MVLTAADKLGPYQIVERIGAGGMGEVYKARDTRLERTVAIKVSAERFSDRFQREAQAIASLNHAHICTLHDVGPDYLVMEYIDGKRLKGPLPISEVLRLGIQIADAVSHAHRNGVVHRDLKPGNIMVTKSGVKVLDFGLAKLSNIDTNSFTAKTVTRTITQEGAIIGTPSYMSPEQLEGREADARTDIFAFGVLLYEMVSGRPAFRGETEASLIASILASEPEPIATLQPLIPPALDHLIKTCLAKDRDDRRQSMHDVMLELKWIAEAGSQAGVAKQIVAQRKRREYSWWMIAGVLSSALLALAFVHFRERPSETLPLRFEQPTPSRLTLRGTDKPEISPDGRQLVFSGAMPGEKQMLWLRRMDSLETASLPGTDDAIYPFWSPDSRFIAYFAGSLLKKATLDGSPGQVVGEVPATVGGSWNREGVILLGNGNGPIHRISAGLGESKPLLKLDEARKERGQTWPHFLPDGRHFLYLSFVGVPGQNGIYVGSIDSKESRFLINADSRGRFAYPGLLIFARGSNVTAQPFNPQKLRLEGEPFPVAGPVEQSAANVFSGFSSSLNGVLVYRPSVSRNRQPVWYDRHGKQLGLVGDPRPYNQVSLSPDEKTLAAQITDPQLQTDDLWLLDLKSAILSRFTSNKGHEDTPTWSPDGSEIAFDVVGDRRGIYRKVIGGGDEQLVLSSNEYIFMGQWLRDGSHLLLNFNGRAFLRLPPGAGRKPQTLLNSEYANDGPRVSPDGRWIAYNTNESGRWEVYLASFPNFTQRRQLSNAGGVQGYWRKDGKELFYLSLDGNMMSVAVKLASPLETGLPQLLFETKIPVSPFADQFAVTSDGRFLALDRVDADAKPIITVSNWPALAPK